ncbi:hypothetical protein ABVT39_000983 [Epinephelus coioides]
MSGPRAISKATRLQTKKDDRARSNMEKNYAEALAAPSQRKKPSKTSTGVFLSNRYETSEEDEVYHKEHESLTAAAGSDVKEEDISTAHQLGGVKKQGKMRPVTVRFVSRRKKANLMEKMIKLKENDTYNKVFICEDLTNMRYKLFRYAKDKCDHTFLRDGKVISKKHGKYITINNPDDLFLIGYDNVDYKDFGIDL